MKLFPKKAPHIRSEQASTHRSQPMHWYFLSRSSSWKARMARVVAFTATRSVSATDSPVEVQRR